MHINVTCTSEYCARGLLNALVIVQYMHVLSHTVQYMHVLYNFFNGKWCARDRSLYKEAEEQWETAGVITGKSITGTDKHK